MTRPPDEPDESAESSALAEVVRRAQREGALERAEAQRELYERLVGEAGRFLLGLRLGLSAGEVEDALQETFVRLFRALPRFDPEREVLPYALGIARHVALDLLAKRPEAAGSEVEGLTAGGRTVGSDAAREEERDLVNEALQAIGTEHAAVLTLRHQNGLTMAQLAEALECSVPTARKRLRDAARLLRGELAARGVGREEEVQ
ncbi:MAG: RNA polymerase sigma factor [Planctomycetota bacterium]